MRALTTVDLVLQDLFDIQVTETVSIHVVDNQSRLSEWMSEGFPFVSYPGPRLEVPMLIWEVDNPNGRIVCNLVAKGGVVVCARIARVKVIPLPIEVRAPQDVMEPTRQLEPDFPVTGSMPCVPPLKLEEWLDPRGEPLD